VGRRREHDEKTAAALLDAAESTIAKDGVDALSLREVARDAGTTTRAIYSLFGSKEGLLGALGVRAFNLLQAEVEALSVTDQPGGDLVEAALIFRRFALEHPALFEIAFHRCDPAISPRVRAARLDALAALETRFEPLAEANLLGGRSVPEATLQFALLCDGVAWGELRGKSLPPDPERFWRNTIHALITGFAAPAPARPRRTSPARGRTVAASRTGG
jgi:AcrR family transcriptional regulator